MQHKLNTGFSQLPETDFDNKAGFIIQQLTGNAAFPTTTPTLASVGTALDAYRKAVESKGPGRTEAVRKARGDLELILGQLAVNLESKANVTDAELATTGFDMRKPRSLTDALVEAPQNLRLKSTGVSGEIQIMCEPVDRAKAYQVQKSLDPEPNTGWTDAGTFASTRGMSLGSLDRAKDIWIRVRALGPNGSGPWSDPATILVS
jgi:hypothetical protein